ncbi:MAG: protein kinase [Polyangiaceae bacterium]|nr:protein kinase [Polyangiaceae bacterium]
MPFLLQTGQTIAGRYVLDAVLGSGGMGEVWSARDTSEDRRVAIKFIKGDALGVDGKRRMLREARASRSVDDPGIVPVFDVIESDAGEPALVMELLEGESLAMKSRPMTAELAMSLLSPVARALAAAHAAGIVHRDVKPENIFVTRSGDVKIVDFGIAKRLQLDADTAASLGTQTGAILGTPQYMSPEQAFGEKDVDHRTDVWSLGVVFFQMLTGSLPIKADNLGQILRLLVSGTMPRVRDAAATVDPELASLVDRMLRQEREERPSMAEVVSALEQIASGEREAKAAVIRVGESDSNDAWDATQAPTEEPESARSLASDSLLERIAGLDGKITPSDDLDRSGHRLAKYQIIEKLGQGGMGIVYVAEDLRLKRKVALKVLPTRLVRNEERRLRFLREARSASAVHHPNVATIFDVGEDNGIVYIAMERVKGQTLRSVLRESGAIAPHRAASIALDIARGLGCAHENGVIHRDIKPENVMIAPDDRAKILDFGLAKSLGVTDPAAGDDEPSDVLVSRVGRVLGTPAYMSPEQAAGDAVDARADIYAMGVVLHEMITGRRPARDAREGRKLTAPIEAIVSRCIGPLERRYPDGDALASALTDVEITLRRGPRRRLAWIGVGLAASAAVVVALSSRPEAKEEKAPGRAEGQAQSAGAPHAAPPQPSGEPRGVDAPSASVPTSAPPQPDPPKTASASANRPSPPKRRLPGPDPLSQQK